MPVLTVRDGVRLHVREEGSGPTLLILPGWGVSTWWFRHQFAALSPRFRVVAYDPRGQGESETARGQRVARLAADLDEVIRHIGADQVHLVAWSGGGSTVLQYIELYGADRLGTLTLVGAGPKLMKADDWEHGFTDLAGAAGWVELIRTDFEAAARAVLPQFFAEPLSDDDLEVTVAEMCKCHPPGMAAASWDFLTQDHRDVLPSVPVPTLVVTGSADTAVPAGNAPYLAAAIPDARLEVIEGTAHCPFLERPDAFNEVVEKFLAGR
ncbi:alpha/beta fold hydrolase [Geodermatophilus sp. TF02-6]|uniref:alpha/beta fold hydrolase n=1 Tax=Geodermatophilus sp. TF02-6 TaxID=2250575 RepID=UPI0013146B1C|nr:alpha/beta hydrolase [Geodermatophilus sp. TF02-6]